MEAPQANDQNLSIVLEKLSVHLDALAGKIFSAEEELSDFINKEEFNTKTAITKFQSLDFTRQSLEDCALLLCLMRENCALTGEDVSNVEDIRKRLKLDTTRQILLGNGDQKEEGFDGEVDFF